MPKFTYYTTAGIKKKVPKHNKAYAAWAEPYDYNTAIKHNEVAALLSKSVVGG